MWPQDNYKKALKSYRNGFGFGVLIGVSTWLISGKVIYTLPIILGLFLGAFAFNYRIRQEQKNGK